MSIKRANELPISSLSRLKSKKDGGYVTVYAPPIGFYHSKSFAENDPQHVQSVQSVVMVTLSKQQPKPFTLCLQVHTSQLI